MHASTHTHISHTYPNFGDSIYHKIVYNKHIFFPTDLFSTFFAMDSFDYLDYLLGMCEPYV